MKKPEKLEFVLVIITRAVPTLGTSREVLAIAWAMIYSAELPHKCSILPLKLLFLPKLL